MGLMIDMDWNGFGMEGNGWMDGVHTPVFVFFVCCFF
jgi:hypothetical protein